MEPQTCGDSCEKECPVQIESLNYLAARTSHHHHSIAHPHAALNAPRPVCTTNRNKVYNMRFQLFECTIQRDGHTARAYVVAPTQDAAWLAVIEHEEALGLEHEDLSLKRIDDVIGQELRPGLDDLLASAPVCFASFAGRWVAHTAPVKQLKLFRTADDAGDHLYAIAPNVDVAASVFASELPSQADKVRLIRISDGMADLPEDMVGNLPRLLEFGPVGVAIFSDGSWSVKD